MLFVIIIVMPAACAEDRISPSHSTVSSPAFTSGSEDTGRGNFSVPWTLVNADAGWSPRAWHSSVVMPDGSIVLTGGMDNSFLRRNDTWRSTDNGTTWTLMSAGAGWSARYGQSCVVMPDGSILLMGGYDADSLKNDTWRSTDMGATWTQVNGSSGWPVRFGHSSVAMPDGSIVLVGGRGNFVTPPLCYNDTWRSEDTGATWNLVNASDGWPARGQFTAVAMPDSSIVLMGGYDSSGKNGVKDDTWRSTDAGATWTQVNTGAWNGRYDYSSAVMPDGSIVLMGGVTMNFIRMNDTWRSTDDGASWTRLTTRAGWPARYGQSSAVTAAGSIVLTGGTAYGGDGGDMHDVWQFLPEMSATGTAGGIQVIKAVHPTSLKAGTDARITITVINRGSEPVHDVEILDTTQPEFPVTDGITRFTAPLIGPHDSRILTYTVHATKSGSFRLNATAVMYADQDGNYHIAHSDYEKVDVLAPLIDPTPKNGAGDFFQDIFAWFARPGHDPQTGSRIP